MAMQNYYQLLQIAHLINQLVEKSRKVATSLKATGRTIKAIWEDATATMLKETIHLCEAAATYLKTRQIRY